MYINPLFLFHIFSHISIIPMVIYANVYDWLVFILVYHIFGCLGIAITYHRLLSHKSFKTNVWFERVGTVLGVLAAIGSTIEWCAVHRKHHRYSDTDKDPHNPKLFGFLYTQFFTMLLTKKGTEYSKYVVDLLRSDFHKNIHSYYWFIHLLYLTVLLLINPFLIISAYLFPCAVLWQVMSALGTFAHSDSFGYSANTSKSHNAKNLWILGIFAFGEGWHYNHHTEASRYKFGIKKYEFDLSAKIINIIKIDK
jgi:fatty-acid desaturase